MRPTKKYQNNLCDVILGDDVSTFWIKPVKIVYITNLSMETERKIVGKWLTPHFDHNKCPFKKNDI